MHRRQYYQTAGVKYAMQLITVNGDSEIKINTMKFVGAMDNQIKDKPLLRGTVNATTNKYWRERNLLGMCKPVT